MSRRRWIVAYDVRDAKRLRRVFKTLKGFGDHLQYSVFLCELDRSEKAAMCLALADLIQHREDSVAVVDLGPMGSGSTRSPIEYMGVRPPVSVPQPRVL